ncbi:18079_t:CDS:2, partial [Racocetra fulgida]
SDPSTNEKELILSGLKEGIRLDGRGMNDFRPLKINLGPEYGRSEVKLVTRPYPDRPTEGILTLNTELSPMAFAGLESGSDLWVVDPSLKEEQIRRGDMTIAINNHKEICVLSKAGGIPLEMGTIIQCSKLAA